MAYTAPKFKCVCSEAYLLIYSGMEKIQELWYFVRLLLALH